MSSPRVLPARPAPAGPLRRLLARVLTGALLRFLVVGGGATVVDVGLFNLLHLGAGADPFLAKTLSTVAGAVVAYLGNRWWTFRSGTDQSVAAQVGPYVLVTVVSLGVALVPVAVARACGLTGPIAVNLAANVVGLGLATAFRFWAQQRWVFAPAADPAEVAEPVAEDVRRAA